jgi:hypothetical protein
MSELTDIQRSLGRIEGKLDSHLDHMKTRDQADMERDKRIASVERRQWWLSGVAAVIGGLLGFGGGHGVKM